MKGQYRPNPFRTSTFLCVYELEDVSFEYSFSNLSFAGVSSMYYTYQANRPSKVVCTIARADTTMDQLRWDQSAHYFHSNRSYTQEETINTVVGQDSRMFCQVTDLTTDMFYTAYFKSNPFIIRCTSFFIR